MLPTWSMRYCIIISKMKFKEWKKSMKLVLICQIFVKILRKRLQSVFEKMGTSGGAGGTLFVIVSNKTLGLCLLEEIRALASLTMLLDWNMMSLECIWCNWSVVDFHGRSAFRHLCLKQQMVSFNQGDELTERTSHNNNLFSLEPFVWYVRAAWDKGVDQTISITVIWKHCSWNTFSENSSAKWL